VTADDSAETKSADSDSGSGKFTAEAAKWRVRCRELEAEKAQLTARIDAMHTATIETIAATKLAQPGDLLALGATDLASLRGDDGELDAERVSRAVDALLTLRPGLAVLPEQELPPTFDGGVRTSPARASGPTYSDVLSGRAARGYDNLQAQR
jgi:hypothetical protein